MSRDISQEIIRATTKRVVDGDVRTQDISMQYQIGVVVDFGLRM